MTSDLTSPTDQETAIRFCSHDTAVKFRIQSSCRREINLYNCMILYKVSIWDICELILSQGIQDVYDFLHLKTPK